MNIEDNFHNNIALLTILEVNIVRSIYKVIWGYKYFIITIKNILNLLNMTKL